MKGKLSNTALTAIISVAVAVVVFAAAFTAGFFTHKLTRSAPVSSYELALDTINKNYFYGVDGDVTETALAAIALKYLDRYSEYYTAEEYKALVESNSGNKTGIGISYSFVEGKGIFINTVTGNSPAYKCGLRAGEFLTGGSTENAQKEFSSSKDFQELIDSAADGENISLTASDGASYTVAKADYRASYTYMCTNETAWTFCDSADGGLALKESREEKMDFLPDGAAYINLSQFYGTAAEEFYVLVEKFNAESCTSLILDLRSDGGGYVNVMQKIAGCFSDGQVKTAMISRDKDGKEVDYKCPSVSVDKRISKDVEVYVLANSGTASASEALMGAMICYEALRYENIFLSDYSDEYKAWLKESGQEVKTARTYGKGIMQTTFVNRTTHEALKLTTAQIYWPDGVTCIHDRGITEEDGCKTVAAEWVRTKDDKELKDAVQMIKAN
ncbi:MAG: hypothetical protein K2G96_02165 [Clostridia bacterium]|nr:hypothetical protein [Clostridia bacterium]